MGPMLLDAPPLPGDSVGPYLLREVLGVGGMATVYRATDRQGRAVALKILHPGKAETDDGRRFQREFLTLRELRDPNIVQVYEAGVQGDYPWIAMELVEGTDLGSLVERWGAHPPADRFAQVERMLRGLCQALAHVHAMGLIHRDLKPSNVLVTRDGQAKLTDFGVVKAPGQFTTQLTLAGRLVGTIAFMAPEQITGEPIDARSDLYSLGAVLYVMLTGRKPIEADTIAGYLARHLTQPPAPPSVHDPAVPPRLEAICLKLLSKDPAQRFPSAWQVLAALDEAAGPSASSLQGRQADFDGLLSRMGAVADGQGGVLLIQGPRGSGASSLLQQALPILERGGRVRIAAVDGAQPDALARLVRLVGGGAALDDPAMELGMATQGAPWVLVVDHLDQLDASAQAALVGLVRQQVAIQGEPLLLVGALSALRGPLLGLADGADTGVVAERWPLLPLDPRAIHAMLRAQGLLGEEARVLARRLHQASGGLPGQVVELVEGLVREGWLRREADGGLRCALAREALAERPLPIPPALRGALDRRLARLSPGTRRLLAAAAVLGSRCSLEQARAIAEEPAEAVGPFWEEVLATGLARRVVEGHDEVVELESERLREALLESLPEEQRRALHGRAAQALQRRSRRRPEGGGEELLRHLLAAGEVGQAFPLLLASAKRRLAAGQAESAGQLLRRASELQPGMAERLPPEELRRLTAQLLALKGEAAWRLGDLTGAQDAWQGALHHAQALGDRLAIAQARAGAGMALSARGEWRPAVELLRQAIAELPPGDPLWPAAGQALAEVELGQGRIESAGRILAQVAQVAEGTGNVRLLARARAGQALSATVRLPVAEVVAQLRVAAAALRVAEENAALVPVLLRLGEFTMADGRLHEAREAGLEAERVAQAGGRLEARIHGLALAGAALRWLGEEAEARLLAREAAAMASARGGSQGSATLLALTALARLLLDLGLPDEAGAVLPDEALALGEGMDGPTAQWGAVRARLEARRRPATLPEAQRQLFLQAPPVLDLLRARVALDLAQAHLEARLDPGPALAEVEKALRAPPLRVAPPRLVRVECAVIQARWGQAPDAERLALAWRLDGELGLQGRLARRLA